MKKDQIQSRELKSLILLKLNKFDIDEVTDEDFEQITDMVFDFKSLNGEYSGISLDDFSLFPNLKSVRIANLRVTQDVIDRIEQLQKVSRIDFARCRFDSVDFKSLRNRLETVSYNKCGVLPFKYPKVRKIHIVDSEVDLDNIDFTNVESVFIVSSIVRNAHGLVSLTALENVCLDGTRLFNEYEELVQDIEVAKDVSYSHKAERLLFDTER